MENKDYQKVYKKLYNTKNKIITFPLNNTLFSELRKKAIYLDLKTNSCAKHILITYLNNTPLSILGTQEKKFISDYIHISRGIANNINQIAYKTNIDEKIDIDILIDTIKLYEKEFKKFITNK